MAREPRIIGSVGRVGRCIATIAAALSASALLVMTPTKASAFDVSGMIGTAMAIKAQIDAHRGGYGGYHGHSRVASRHDSDSDDQNSSGGGERDARDSEAVDRASRPDNRVAMHREVLGPSSTSGGLAQASERDAAAEENQPAGRAFDDRASFKPSR